MGPKGVGKTCLVESATERTPGVIRINVRAGMSSDEIIRKAMLEIANLKPFVNFMDPLSNAKRVLFFHNIFFSSRPIVTISLSERSEKNDPAEITAAVRELLELGVRVVIDASPNSLDSRILDTNRYYNCDYFS